MIKLNTRIELVNIIKEKYRNRKYSVLIEGYATENDDTNEEKRFSVKVCMKSQALYNGNQLVVSEVINISEKVFDELCIIIDFKSFGCSEYIDVNKFCNIAMSREEQIANLFEQWSRKC